MLEHIQLKFILLVLISFSFIKTQKDIELVNGFYSNIIDSKEELLSFKIKAINNSSYIKIKAEGTGQTEKTNHIISYYQEENLKERKQLSQSITDASIMWLTKEQIQKDFYITIECAKFPCQYNFSLSISNTAELDVNGQYTFFVTEDNKEMKFRLNSNTDLNLEDLYITIWTRGNFGIDVALNNENKPNSKYHFFQKKYNDFYHTEYELTVKGKVGDLINVGVLLVHKEEGKNDFPQLKIEEGLEITNNLIQNETQVYNISSYYNMILGHFYDFNNKIIYPSLDFNFSYYNLSASDKELSYSIHFLNTTKYDKQGNNKYSPLLVGTYYIKLLEEGTSIGLIPMKPQDDFNFLTYEIFQYEGNISAYVYKCENYPLCHIDENTLEKSEIIKDYQSYYYTYYKDEWEKEINPISKKQNMLIIKCKKGLNINNRIDICISIINMKTNINEIDYTDFIKEGSQYRRFIKKDNEDLYFFEGNKDEDVYLNIQIFTGNISIDINPNDNIKKFEFGNTLLYIIPRNIDIKLKIKGETNSVYSIYDNKYAIRESLKIGSNYLLNLGEKNQITIIPRDKSYFPNSNDYLYYIGIYSVNCIIYVNEDEDNKQLKEKEFYQNIEHKSPRKSFSLNKLDSENKEENCLIYVSCHKLEDFASDSNGIPLGNNTSQSFIFNKDINFMLFSFPHTEIENNIKIDFKTEGKYKVKIMADGKNIKDDNINSNKLNIQLKASELKKQCDNFKFICKILLNLESEEKEKESKIEIIINSIKNEDNEDNEDNKDNKKPNGNNDDDDDDDDNKKYIIIFSIVGAIIIILIGGGIFYYCKIYSKNRDLNQAVNQISFRDENRDTDDDCRDTLLD